MMISRIATLPFAANGFIELLVAFRDELESGRARFGSCSDSLRPDRVIAVISRLGLPLTASSRLPVKAEIFT